MSVESIEAAMRPALTLEEGGDQQVVPWSAEVKDGYSEGLRTPLDGTRITVVVHKLDPRHVNRAIKTAFPEPADAAALFELLHAGRIDELLDVLALRLETGYGDEGKGYEPRSGHLMPFSTRQQSLTMFDPLY
ncbi:MAG: hypothetical protein JW733_07080 [Coriobacteriia bacterium]|nr:hypothetical protein [Coriobacteriia bacterium]